MLGRVLKTKKQRPPLALHMGISRGEGRSLSANKDFMLSIGSVAVLVLVFAYMMFSTGESIEDPTEGQSHDAQSLAEKLPGPGCTLTPMPVNIISRGVPSIPRLDLVRHSPNHPYSMPRTDPSPQAPTISSQYTASKSIFRDPTRDLPASVVGASPLAPLCDDNSQSSARTLSPALSPHVPPSAPSASTNKEKWSPALSARSRSGQNELMSRCREIMAKVDANKPRNNAEHAKSTSPTFTTTLRS